MALINQMRIGIRAGVAIQLFMLFDDIRMVFWTLAWFTVANNINLHYVVWSSVSHGDKTTEAKIRWDSLEAHFQPVGSRHSKESYIKDQSASSILALAKEIHQIQTSHLLFCCGTSCQ